MLRMVCSGVEIEPVLQDITGEELNSVKLDIVKVEKTPIWTKLAATCLFNSN